MRAQVKVGQPATFETSYERCFLLLTYTSITVVDCTILFC